MDNTMFVILLLAGVYVPVASSSYVYYFINTEMSWFGASKHCSAEYMDLAYIDSEENQTAIMSTPTMGYKGKAWIGLFDDTTWDWTDKDSTDNSSWYNYQEGEPDNKNGGEFCVSMMMNGEWKDDNCSLHKPAICAEALVQGLNFSLVEPPMDWKTAKSVCRDLGYFLATVPDRNANIEIQALIAGTEFADAWIGLNRPEYWYWTHTTFKYKFINWQPQQPDNKDSPENCGTMVVEDGTWTDERCYNKYPFFCFGVLRTQRTVVKLKIQSAANMADPAISADLLQQLHTAFVNRGVGNFRLTWTKVPVKERPVTITGPCVGP